MVIQRWQTVWLLIAAILMAVFCFVPMALVTGVTTGADSASVTPLMPADMPVLLAVAILTALLLAVTIFLFKDTRRQRTLTLMCMLLIAATAVTEALVIFNWDTTSGDSVSWMGSVFLLVGAFVFAFLAYRGIRHDENLLRAADRLR